MTIKGAYWKSPDNRYSTRDREVQRKLLIAISWYMNDQGIDGQLLLEKTKLEEVLRKRRDRK